MEKLRPYQRFHRTQLILRDELAVDRTILANERTFLYYVRLSISLIFAGISSVPFSMEKFFETVGFLCVPTVFGAGIYGWLTSQKLDGVLLALKKPESRKWMG